MFIVTVLRTLFWNFIFWGLLVVSQIFIPYFLILEKLGKNDHRARFASKLATFWAGVLIKFSGSTLTIHGKENIPADHSYTIVANHQGYFDIAIILYAIPWTVGFVAKKELSKIPFLHSWMRTIGVVFMDRKDKRAAISVMKMASDRIKSGQPMVIFPEGTRSQGGPIAEFKQGSLKLATLSKTRILPVTIKGTHNIIEGEKWGINPTKMEMWFHPIIDTETIPEDELPTLAERLREVISVPMGTSE